MAKEYIEREAAKARLRIWITDCVLAGDNDEADCYRDCIDLLDSIPAADVAPVRRGEWLNFYGDFSTAECELCAELHEVSPDESPQKEYFDAFKEFYRYCPNCGAKMDGKELKIRRADE